MKVKNDLISIQVKNLENTLKVKSECTSLTEPRVLSERIKQTASNNVLSEFVSSASDKEKNPILALDNYEIQKEDRVNV